MKYLMIILTAGIFFTACKSNKDADSKKDLILLQTDNNSYLTDTGINATTDVRSGVVEDHSPMAAPTRNVAPSKSTPVRNSNVSNSGNSTNTGSNSSTTSNQKQGVSKAAKGAIIGGVGGAAAGAVIGKNAKGAVIGGVVGAAGGYIIGRNKDKKSGRVQ